jgi:hypothetical protein
MILHMATAADPSWTDIGIFWATLGGVIATFAAVLVALFGQRLHQWRRRPQITVTSDPPSMGIRVDPDSKLVWTPSASVLRLRLHNEPGRDTARDVEVFVDAVAQVGFVTFEAADSANLNFDDPTDDDGPGRSIATVPSGYSRRVNFAVLMRGGDQDVHNEDEARNMKIKHEAWGYLAVYPPSLTAGSTLHDNASYDVRITVTGANFDAISYRGVVAFEDEEDTDLGPLKYLTWKEPLAKSTGTTTSLSSELDDDAPGDSSRRYQTTVESPPRPE